MGLSVVHGIVRGHGGPIDVTGRVGQGACFAVYLPRLVAEEDAANVSEPMEQLQTGSEPLDLVIPFF